MTDSSENKFRFGRAKDGTLEIWAGGARSETAKAPGSKSFQCLQPVPVRRSLQDENSGFYASLQPYKDRPCRRCEACQRALSADWAGRCYAEWQHSDAAIPITLTYKDDHKSDNPLAHQQLYYRDVVLAFKRMRKAGLRLRYICAGEYGTQSTLRSHWHMILFLRGEVPDLPTYKRFDWDFWPHGKTWAELPNFSSFYYVTKYITKDAYHPTRKREFRMSKRPLIGADYFRDLAINEYSAKGLVPVDPEYRFKGDAYEKKTPFNFRMFGAARNLFQKAFVEDWQQRWPGRPMPHSDWLEVGLDRMEREARKAQEAGQSIDEFRADLERRQRDRHQLTRDAASLAELPSAPAPAPTEELYLAPYKPDGRSPKKRRRTW